MGGSLHAESAHTVKLNDFTCLRHCTLCNVTTARMYIAMMLLKRCIVQLSLNLPMGQIGPFGELVLDCKPHV